MATYEMYMGGPRQANPTFAIFPSAPFSQSNPTLPPAAKTPIMYGDGVTFNFGGTGAGASPPPNQALQTFVQSLVAAGTPIATGDKFGAVVIPAQSLFFGVFYSVNVPTTGLSFELIQRVAATTLLTATSAGTVTSGWAFAQATPFQPLFMAESDIIDLDFSTVPAGGVQNLSITVVPLFATFLLGGHNS
jgi:hypothetical protein